MKAPQTSGLLQYLRQESAAYEPARADEGAVAVEEPALRVPLELDGALWSAVVERIAGRSIALIVDREALGALADPVEGAIHYQPDNAAMQCARGQVTAADVLAGQRVRLNFELS